MISDISFGNFSSFWLIIPIIIFYYYSKIALGKEKKLKDQITPVLFNQNQKSADSRFKLTPLLPLIIVLTLLVFALSKPRSGYEKIKSQSEGVDIALAVDVSTSMLSEDVSPDRLSVLRRKVKDFIKIIQGDRISLISFAGTAFIEAPLTLDYNIISMFANSIYPDLAPLQGSNLLSLVRASVKTLNNPERSKVLIILSDGEFDPEYTDEAFKILEEESIVPFLIAIGTDHGAPVPSKNGFKRDENGEIVFSRSDVNSLIDRFESLGGTAIRFSPDDSDLKTLYSEYINNKLDKSKIENNMTRIWNEYYQVPLLISILLLAFIWVFKITKSKKRNYDFNFKHYFHLFNKRKLTSYLISTFISFSILIAMNYNNAKADELNNFNDIISLYNQGKFKEVLEKLKNKNLNNSSYDHNLLLGNTLYRIGDFSRAAKAYEKASSQANNEDELARTLFNQANSLTQSGELEKAKEIFENALKINPDDSEIQKNLQYVDKLIDKPKNDSESSEDNEEDNSEKQENEDEQEKSSQDKDDTGSDQDRKSESSKDEKKDQTNSNNENNSDSKDTQEKSQTQDQKNQADKQSSDKESEQKDNNSIDNKPKNELKDFSGKDQDNNKEGQDYPSQETTQNIENQNLESLLEAIDESTTARAKHRYRKAVEELRKRNQSLPQMDW